MHEHGLGVPRDYDLALIYYDRVRRNVPAVGDDVDQRLNGMPTAVLITIAKLRCEGDQQRLSLLQRGRIHLPP